MAGEGGGGKRAYIHQGTNIVMISNTILGEYCFDGIQFRGIVLILDRILGEYCFDIRHNLKEYCFHIQYNLVEYYLDIRYN